MVSSFDNLKTTDNVFDSYGNITETTIDPYSDVTNYRQYSSSTYTEQGKLLETETSYVEDKTHVTRYEYDAFGNLTKVTDPNGCEYTYTYDVDDLASVSANGCTNEIIRYIDRKISAYQHNGFTNAFQYDGYNQINHNFTNLGHTRFRITNTYSENGSTQNVTVNYSNDPGVFVEYDKYGRVIKSGKDAQTIDLMNIYCDNDTDTLTNVTNPNDPILKINANSPLRKRIVSGKPEYFYYKDDGSVSKANNDIVTINKNETTFNLSVDNVLDNTCSPVEVKSIYYPILGDKNVIDNPTEFEESKETYSGNVQYYEICAEDISPTTDVISTTTKTDDIGRKEKSTLEVNLITDTEHYNKTVKEISYLPRSVPTAGSTSLVGSVKYSNTNDEQFRQEEYTYDGNGNIKTVTIDGTLACTYHYDNLNRLIRVDDNSIYKSYTYTYDNGGNITNQSFYYYSTGNLNFLLESTDYHYENPWKDQLTSYEKKGSGGNVIESYTITYDGYGNPTQYKGNNLSWDKINQLKQYGSTTFTYNGLGQIIQKDYVNNYGNATVKYVYDPNGKLIAEQRKQTPTEENLTTLTGENIRKLDNYTLVYLYSGKELIGFKYYDFYTQDNCYTCYYLKNIFGDVIGLRNAAGDTIVKYTYTPYGAPSHSLPFTQTTSPESKSPISCSYLANRNPYRYRGYYYDKELSLYHLQTRYYDPQTGRFISPDTIEYLDPISINGLNLYTYCLNNPIMCADPSGHWIETVFDILSLAASVVEVVVNPLDVWAWAGLAGDALDLIPFATGLGETVKGYRVVAKVADISDDALDAIKIGDRAKLAEYGLDIISFSRATNFTNEALSNINKLDNLAENRRILGINIHTGFMFKIPGKEFGEYAGIRPDYYNKGTRALIELKPFNRRSLIRGVKQLLRYEDVIGGNCYKMLQFYAKYR